MTTEVLLKLLDAGYTKADIERMEEVEAKPAPEPQPAPTEKEVPEEPEKKPETPEQPSASETMTKTIEEIMQVIGKMQKTLDGIQKKNASAAEGAEPERVTADTVIKDFFGAKKKA